MSKVKGLFDFTEYQHSNRFKGKHLSCSYHCHSDASIDGGSTVKDIVARCAELEMTHVSLTEHGELSSAAAVHRIVAEYNKKNKTSMKVIHGVEGYLFWPEDKFTNPLKPAPTYHITIGFKTQAAFEAYCKLTPLIYSEPRIRYAFGDAKPCMLWEDFLELSQHGVVIGTGCVGSWLNKPLCSFGDIEEAKKRLDIMIGVVGKDNIYDEVIVDDLSYQYKPVERDPDTNRVITEASLELNECRGWFTHPDVGRETNRLRWEHVTGPLGIRKLFSQDAHYANKKDKIVQDNKRAGSDWIMSMFQHLKGAEEISLLGMETNSLTVRDCEEFIDNTHHYADQFSGYKFRTAEEDGYLIPKYEGDSRQHIMEKIEARGRLDLTDPVVTERIKYELDVLSCEPKVDGLAYMRAVGEIEEMANDNGILMNARGSAGGSLVAYGMGISVTDPIKYNLPFERFLTPGRIKSGSLPDIDCIAHGQPVLTEDGWVPIEDIRKTHKVGCLNEATGVVEFEHPLLASCKGERQVQKYTFEDGLTIECTPDHKVLTRQGWVGIHKAMEKSLEVKMAYRAHFAPPSALIVSNEILGKKKVYDLSMPTHHNFIVNFAVVHNCDFSNKDAIMELVNARWGDKTAPISIDLLLKPRSAIKDAERYLLGAVRPDTEVLTKSMPQVPQGVDETDWMFGYEDAEGVHVLGYYEQSEALQKYAVGNPEIWESVLRMCGVMRQKSSHACGVLISKVPIHHVMPLTRVGGKKGQLVTAYGPKDIEYVGGVKVDILGVQALNSIEQAFALIKKRTGKQYVWGEMPHDEKVYKELYHPGKTDSTFQTRTTGITKLCVETKPSSVEEISNLIALYRPSCLDWEFDTPDFKGNAVEYYVKCKQGIAKPRYIHPDLEPIFGSTMGIPILQEQVLRTFRDLGDYTYETAEVVRRGISKKDLKILAEHGAILTEAVLKKGWTQEQAKDLFNMIVASSRYGFNAAHSISYGLVSYATAYLKYNYPLEWWCAEHTVENDNEDKIRDYADLLGDLILQPSILHSDPCQWQIQTVNGVEKLRPPLVTIKGIGNGVATDLLRLISAESMTALGITRKPPKVPKETKPKPIKEAKAKKA